MKYWNMEWSELEKKREEKGREEKKREREKHRKSVKRYIRKYLKKIAERERGANIGRMIHLPPPSVEKASDSDGSELPTSLKANM